MFASATQFCNVQEWNDDGRSAHRSLFVCNSPPNFTDPTGMYQAGNPPDSLYGGYRAGAVQPAKNISQALSAGSVPVSTNALLNLPAFSNSARKSSNGASLGQVLGNAVS